MLHLSPEDVASIGVVLGTLEAQAAELSTVSRIAGLWTDWADALRPTVVEAAAATHADA